MFCIWLKRYKTENCFIMVISAHIQHNQWICYKEPRGSIASGKLRWIKTSTNSQEYWWFRNDSFKYLHQVMLPDNVTVASSSAIISSSRVITIYQKKIKILTTSMIENGVILYTSTGKINLSNVGAIRFLPGIQHSLAVLIGTACTIIFEEFYKGHSFELSVLNDWWLSTNTLVYKWYNIFVQWS